MRALRLLAVLALLLPSLSQANDGRDTPTKRVPTDAEGTTSVKWVKAEEAGYYPLSVNSEPVNGRSLSFAAGKGPAAPFFRIENDEDWKALLEKIVGDDQEPPAFAPDFRREFLLVVFHRNDDKTTFPFLDLEVYEAEAGLRAFVFHESRGTPPTDDLGWYLVTTVPRTLAERGVKLRFARQDWGRPCSTFGPAIRIAAQPRK